MTQGAVDLSIEDREIVLRAAQMYRQMYRNWLTTGNVHLGISDVSRMDAETRRQARAEIRPLSSEQMKLVLRLDHIEKILLSAASSER